MGSSLQCSYREVHEAPRIWGDYFNQDTRALLAICRLSEFQVDYNEIDTLQKVNLSENYSKINPTQSVPMITDGRYKIIGDGHAMYKFMVYNYKSIKRHFHVEE